MNIKNINEDEFRKVCLESQTMAIAATKLNMHFNTFKKYAIQFGCYKPNPGGKGVKDGHTKNRIKTKDILNGLYPEYQTFQLKNRLFEEGIKCRKCERCGLSEWNGLPIPCELHHKDGNSHNHRLENLEILCLNCHAQTETFRSKNKK